MIIYKVQAPRSRKKLQKRSEKVVEALVKVLGNK